jgi:hypothetical protein
MHAHNTFPLEQARDTAVFGYRGAYKDFGPLDRTTMPPSPSNTVDTPLQFPTRFENDSPIKPVSNSPRELVRRVVERTSDKLGRSKSVGSKSQLSPKPQRTSPHGSPKRFVSQGRKDKDPQTANTADLGGTLTPIYEFLL